MSDVADMPIVLYICSYLKVSFTDSPASRFTVRVPNYARSETLGGSFLPLSMSAWNVCGILSRWQAPQVKSSNFVRNLRSRVCGGNIRFDKQQQMASYD